MSGKKVWCDSEIITLIEFMLDNPFFYDPSETNFKKIVFKRQMLQDLSESKLKRFNRSEIAQKIKNIKRYYNIESKKIKESESSGIVYVPKWRFFERLHFLEPVKNHISMPELGGDVYPDASKLQICDSIVLSESNDFNVLASSRNVSDSISNQHSLCTQESQLMQSLSAQIEKQIAVTERPKLSLFYLEEKFLLDLPKVKQLSVINRIRKYMEDEIIKISKDMDQPTALRTSSQLALPPPSEPAGPTSNA